LRVVNETQAEAVRQKSYTENTSAAAYSILTRDDVAGKYPQEHIQTLAPSDLKIAKVHAIPSVKKAAKGSIMIIAQGGQPPYTYSINTGLTYSSSNEFHNLCSNYYGAVVKDALGNTAYAKVRID
jgi:hypothetical protein